MLNTPGNRKRSKQSTNTDQKSLETVFSIAICRHSFDKWQSKALFLTIFDLRLLNRINVFDYHLPGRQMAIQKTFF